MKEKGSKKTFKHALLTEKYSFTVQNRDSFTYSTLGEFYLGINSRPEGKCRLGSGTMG